MKKYKNLVIIIILLISILIASNKGSFAGFAIDSADLYKKSQCGRLLIYKGVEINNYFIVYKHNNKEYPAYCVQSFDQGVGEVGSYTVTVEEREKNPLVWRAIVNGYPYKTYQELGCQTKEEAYTATKQAVYCVIHGREPYEYQTIGPAGERTRNAMQQIVDIATSTTNYKPSANIVIEDKQGMWDVDNIDKKYISKVYSIKTEAPLDSYNIIATGNIVNGTIFTDLNNNVKSTYTNGENFKILMPIQELKQNGEFDIKVSAQVETKPVLYGVAPRETLQDYALTGVWLEESEKEDNVKYYANKTRITILKQDSKTKEPIKGVKFNLLNSNKEIISAELTSNDKGLVLLENMLPGKYYLEETQTVGKYLKYDELIEIELELNEDAQIIINNSIGEKTEVTKKNQIIEVNQESLLVNEQISKKNTNIENINKETNIENREEISNITNIKETTNSNNIKKLPRTGM